MYVITQPTKATRLCRMCIYCTNQQGGTNEHERLEKMQRNMEHLIGKKPQKLKIGINFLCQNEHFNSSSCNKVAMPDIYVLLKSARDYK
jgi:hypothetical protein